MNSQQIGVNAQDLTQVQANKTPRMKREGLMQSHSITEMLLAVGSYWRSVSCLSTASPERLPMYERWLYMYTHANSITWSWPRVKFDI